MNLKNLLCPHSPSPATLKITLQLTTANMNDAAAVPANCAPTPNLTAVTNLSGATNAGSH